MIDLLRFFFNPHCLGCGVQNERLICESCNAQRQPFPPHCLSCNQKSASKYCLNCQNQRIFNRVFVADRFVGLSRQMILRAKFQADRSALKVLEEWITAIHLDCPPNTVIIPLPIAFWRLVQRGYNQTDYLAKALAQTHHLRCEKRLLRREYRPPQALIKNRQARQENIANAFYLSASPPKSVLLVDDVMTTGSTLKSAGRLFRQHGSTWVGAIVVAST